MADQDNYKDRLADRNLKMIGRRLDLPEPTALQQARWKQAPSSATAGDGYGAGSREQGTSQVRVGIHDGFIRRHRRLTIATSAVAACIVLAVLLITPGGSKVEAGIILNSLRRTLLDGFQVAFENIGDDGVYVNGRVLVTLRPIDGVRPPTGIRSVDPSELEVESVYAEANLLGDYSDDSTVGLDWQANLALTDRSQWAFLKITGMPDRTLAEEPLAQLIVGLTSNGLLLDLDGLRDLLVSEDQVDPGDSAPASILGDDGDESAQNDIAQLVKDFLIGRAGAEQIDRILELIAQTARDVSLEEIEPGLHVLKVGEFKLDTIEISSAQLAEMTLEVCYREGGGIESAVLRHIGRYDGTLCLSPLGESMDPVMLDKRTFVNPGTTTVWDLSSLKPLLRRFLGRSD